MAKESILFITNSELGQSTVALAVAYELLRRDEYNVHIASYPPLQAAVEELNNDAAKLAEAPINSKIIFHTIAGKSMKEAAARKAEFIEMHPPGIQGALFAYESVLPATLGSWNGPEYMIGYSSVGEIIKEVQPVFCAVDSLYSQGSDVCNELGQKFCILSPNTFKDHAIRHQPGGASLWKYPQICSGFLFPMDWYHTFANIYLTFKVLMSRANNPRLKELSEYRHSCGISGELKSLFGGHGDAPIVCMSTPEIELPFVVPDFITGAGPMLLPTLPIAETHPELASWLSKRPTILVNLGSHILFDAEFASEFAAGLRMLFDRRPDVQVLWKLKTQSDDMKRCYEKDGGFSVISKELADGRVRIESWLPAQPIAILNSGKVICMVHHGGSNSYHEACSAGVPQIVLPVWIDTYDFACKVEYLKIGVWGSQKAAPRVAADELGQALVKVLASNESAGMDARAKAIAATLSRSIGREVAAKRIVELIYADPIPVPAV